MILACTGHRPHKLNREYDYDGPCSRYLVSEITKVFTKEKPEKAISGMAVGSDTLFALVALEMGIPLLAAVPFAGQEKKWPSNSQKIYQKILDNPLTTRHVVSPGGYSLTKMQTRNQYMVDNCNKLLAIHNGSKGGTYNTIQYALNIGRDMIFVNPDNWKNNVKQKSLFQ